MLGGTKEDADKEIRDVVDFQIQLARIFISSEDRRNPKLYYNQKSLKEIQELYPWLDWKPFLNNLMYPAFEIDDNYILNVNDKAYYDNLGALLQETPKRTIANFILFQVAQDAILYLTDSLRIRREAFVKAVTGREDSLARYKECTQKVWDEVDARATALFVREGLSSVGYTPEVKNLLKEIVNNAKSTLQETIQETKWMDESTKTEAVNKIKKMGVIYGYPEELFDDRLLSELYKGFKVVPNDYYGSSRAITKFDVTEMYQRLVRPTEDQWHNFDVKAVDMFYRNQENKLSK